MTRLAYSSHVKQRLARRIRWLIPDEWAGAVLRRNPDGHYYVSFGFDFRQWEIDLGAYNVFWRMRIIDAAWHKFNVRWLELNSRRFISCKLSERSFFSMMMPAVPVDPVKRREHEKRERLADLERENRNAQHEEEVRHLTAKERLHRLQLLNTWRFNGVALEGTFFPPRRPFESLFFRDTLGEPKE